MAYQQRRLEYEVHQYDDGGAQSWSDGGAQSWLDGGAGYPKRGAYGGGSRAFRPDCYGYQKPGAWSTGDGSAGYDSYGSSGSQAHLYKPEVPTMSEMYQPSAGHCRDPFSALVPSSFPPGTDPKFIDCFNRIDKDRNGFICDQELQSALSTFDQRFSLRTVHLLMYMFTGSNAKVVGPKEFVPLVRNLQTWKATFQRYDRDRNGRLDERELRDALMSMGYNVSPFVLKLLMSKFDKSGFKCSVEYDYFIECCVVVKGLTDKFRAKEDSYHGTASFTYDEFLLSVLPFIVA